MKRNRRRIAYATLASLLFLAGTGFDIVMLGSVLNIAPINAFEERLRGDAGLFFILMSLLGVFGAALLVYIVSLDPFGGERPWGWVYLNVAPATGYLAACYLFFSIGVQAAPGPIDIAVAIAVAFLAPVIVFFVEAIAARTLLGLGRMFDARGSNGAAYFFLKSSLRWRPSVHETARRCGLLLVETGRLKHARGLLERLGDLETSEDLEVLRGLERVYYSEHEGALALKSLRRQRDLQPKTKDIDQRILDQCLALERWDEAIAELESGRLVMSLDRLAMLQELYGRAGEIEKAIACSRKVAEKEGAPYPRSSAFLASMLDRKPGNADLLVELGLLLQRINIAEQKERGADHLEKALALDPKRAGLRRTLAMYYHGSLQEQKAETHFRKLIEDKDADPLVYLGYADILRAGSNPRGACQVYRQLREAHPQDWRGFVKEAEILHSLDQIDEARELLAKAQPLIPEGERIAASILQKSLERRRDELNLKAITTDLSRAGEDFAKRIDYVRQLLTLDRGEEAVAECDALLERNPDFLPNVMETLEAVLPTVARAYRVRDYLADLYFRQGRYDDSLRMVRSMAETALNPEKAIEQGCRKILSRAPDHAAARLALGEACMKQESWGAAADALAPLLDAPPEGESVRIRTMWVEASYRAGRIKEAMELGLKLLAEKTADLPYMLLLIRILEDNGAYEDAYDVFKIAFAAYPEDDTLQRMKRTVADNKKRKRMGELQAIEAGDGLTPELHYEKADLHREFNQTHVAIIHYQRAAEQKDLADVALTKLAICLCDRRLFDLANETLEKIELTKENTAARPELKNMFYWVADTMEQELYKKEALKYFKRLFHVDAAFRDIVMRLEKLDSS